MGSYDPDLAAQANMRFERASEHFGELQKLPNVSFRGIACSLLAEQYRRIRALNAPDSQRDLSGWSIDLARSQSPAGATSEPSSSAALGASRGES